MTKPIQLSNDLWLKEIVLNGNPNFADFYKEDLIKMVIICREQNLKYKEVNNKVILELANIDGNLSNSQLSDRICNLIDILKEAER